METPRKRKWLQMHLSTAVILMVTAGFLVWANVWPHYKEGLEGFVLYGWPCTAVISLYARGNYELRYLIYSVAINFAAADGILLAVWFVCEWRIGRRAARKGS